MKLQKFVDILNKKGITASDFFEKNGKNIFTDNKILLALMKEMWGRKKWLKLIRMGWIIEIDLGRKYDKEEKPCFNNILPVYHYFSDYMKHGCTFFGNMRVPFEEWEDLAKEEVDILKILVEKNQLKSWKRTKLVHKFGDKCDERTNLLIKKGLIDPIYIEDPMGL